MNTETYEYIYDYEYIYEYDTNNTTTKGKTMRNESFKSIVKYLVPLVETTEF